MPDPRPIVLAAGGTGGHIFPAEALAETLLKAGERVVLVTDRRFANLQTGALSAIEKKIIRSGTMGKGVVGKALGAANVVLGIMQAGRKLRRLKPKVVIGFGGYPAFPTMYAASGLRIPTVIHEQNAVLGRANRVLANRIDYLATSFHNTLQIEAADQKKVVFTGNPVRSGICAVHHVPYSELTHDGKMQILVTGGSLGATVFSEIVPAAIAALPAVLRARIRIDQQCREADLEATRAAYAQLGVSADLASFFTDIPARLAASHLVIARSGASTVAELAVAGRPAILVPLPSAMDNHQYFNANAFEDVGGGWVMPQEGFTAASLSARLEAFLGSPSSLNKAAQHARAFGRADATQRLVELAFGAARGDRS
jgi:UDP-N-acetylglucosamine--N-acetylmuramyl-(pentapeptide) pyrophosphoryl-undecaprenol N-acetylglucosamine transferase